jgi:DNA-binding transcriptional MocR family regulator
LSIIWSPKRIADLRSNAGIFLWIDLRPWLLPGLSEEDLKRPVIELRYDSPHADQYRQREKEVLTACKELGVFIAYGTNFFTEELGWFRISFTAGKEPMIEGISRIVKALEKIKGKGWKRVEN